MTNLYSAILYLHLCLSLLINPLAAEAEDLYKRQWINSLDSIEKLDAYLNSSYQMAQESLIMNKDGTGVLMGSSTSGDLTLDYCLKKMMRAQSSFNEPKGLVLVVPTVHVFKKADPELRLVQCATWITFLFLVFRGPNGIEPTFPSWDIKQITEIKLLHTMRMELGFTIGSSGKDADGYTSGMLLDMIHYWDAGHFKTVDKFDFSYNIYHITKMDHGAWDMFEYTKNASRVEFYTNEALQDKVDIPLLKSFIEKMAFNMSQCYFNVPLKFLKAYFGDDVLGAGIWLRMDRGILIWMSLILRGMLMFTLKI